MVIFISMMVVFVKGTIDLGGLSRVLEINEKYGRLDMAIFTVDPSVRNTVWSVIIGGYFQWMTIYGVNQTQVSEYSCFVLLL